MNNGTNKINSFRGNGPIRATQNALDNSPLVGSHKNNNVQMQINQSAIVKHSIGSNNLHHSQQQRPNSSKPIMKNSFNHNNNDLMNNTGGSSNLNNELGHGPLTQIVNGNKNNS